MESPKLLIIQKRNHF